MANFTLHFDGSCWPNPGGCAAYGAVLEREGQNEALCAEAGVLETSPRMSNNVAEFHALNIGLIRFIEHGVTEGDTLQVFGDSDLVVKMMTGKYRPKADKLYYPYYLEAAASSRAIRALTGKNPTYRWIPREQNTRCDDLSKEHNHAPK